MSMDAILAALNDAEKIDIAAALAGLSLTAASFIAFLGTEQTKKTELMNKDTQTLQGILGRTSDGKEIEALSEAIGIRDSNSQRRKSLVETASLATRQFLWAFLLFSINLIDKLTLDPFFKEFFEKEKATIFFDLGYEQLLPVDFIISGGTIGFGIFLLMKGAKNIYTLVTTP